MALLVKICGVNASDSADAAVRAGADMVGLVFHPKSPRHLSFEAARSLADHLRGRVQLVTLIADADDEMIAGALAAVRPDFLQLHGRETPERAAALKSRFGVQLIKAFPIASAADFAPVAAFTDIADLFLFDAKAPEGLRPGGHGVAFDWQLLKGRAFPRPWLLAGGLSPANVGRAVILSGAPGVDVSSGVETAPGVKDTHLIAEFLSAARNPKLDLEEARS
ncbi:phosphoribosylanthranilate isomerase [Rhizomicrobium palustre]|uniref:N-(5'-phosphoribosyl)anthranilate isomerase n=1 Tax=Rhizomicrobium palustre TaxID=189966 RepID=A0A846N5P3_9PROT|nr:phosphoribosylanthranilate isomerase [Rhizomicrobium palustre]NIK90501.1 phosphoribosylanthranilate isomerase [Rhizomicrobium palustre]